MSITTVIAEDRQKNSVVILEHKPSFETGDYLVKSFKWYGNEADAKEAYEAAIKPTRKKRAVNK